MQHTRTRACRHRHAAVAQQRCSLQVASLPASPCNVVGRLWQQAGVVAVSPLLPAMRISAPQHRWHTHPTAPLAADRRPSAAGASRAMLRRLELRRCNWPARRAATASAAGTSSARPPYCLGST
jgi:hypothetical protein